MLQGILEQTFLKNKGFPRNEEHQIIVVFGDLNFRISLDNTKAREAVNKHDIGYLKQFDELICLRNSKDVNQIGHGKQLRTELREALQNKGMTALVNSLDEAEITFLPTYKFDKGLHNYDSSRKMRVPSYTDRILFQVNPTQLKCLEYKSIPSICFSDHKPVCATLQVFLSESHEGEPSLKELQEQYNKTRAKTTKFEYPQLEK